MSSRCGEPYPADEKILCEKSAHKWGPHFNQTTGTHWNGILAPVRAKQGKKRVEKVIGSIKEPGKVGPPVSGAERRDIGMAKVLKYTAEEYKDEFAKAYLLVMGSDQPFTSENITAMVGMPPGHQNAVGAQFSALLRPDLKSGHVLYLGHVSAQKAERNANKIGQYRRDLN